MLKFRCATSASSATRLNPLHGKLEFIYAYVFYCAYIDRRISGAGGASGARLRRILPPNHYAAARVARAFCFPARIFFFRRARGSSSPRAQGALS
jgi:hypothetical protein